MPVLDRVIVVLLEPQNPVNIAATIRAMRNMGLSALRLVRPVAYTPEQIETIAHDTMDLVAAARHFDDLDGALADCVDVIAYTARRRAAKRTVLTPREAAARLVGGEGDGPAFPTTRSIGPTACARSRPPSMGRSIWRRRSWSRRTSSTWRPVTRPV